MLVFALYIWFCFVSSFFLSFLILLTGIIAQTHFIFFTIKLADSTCYTFFYFTLHPVKPSREAHKLWQQAEMITTKSRVVGRRLTLKPKFLWLLQRNQIELIKLSTAVCPGKTIALLSVLRNLHPRKFHFRFCLHFRHCRKCKGILKISSVHLSVVVDKAWWLQCCDQPIKGRIYIFNSVLICNIHFPRFSTYFFKKIMNFSSKIIKNVFLQ